MMRTELFYYLILFVYVSLWLCQLVACHLTHSLIILTESYINLYRILDISLGIVHLRTQKELARQQDAIANGQTVDETNCRTTKRKTPAEKLFNAICTYQYKRLPLLGSFINGLFLAALLMSAAIEGIQTCLHSGHSQGSGEKSILNENVLTFPIILVGFAIVSLIMQYCSMKAHEMREEELCSNSLLDLQLLNEAEEKAFESIELTPTNYDNAKIGSQPPLAGIVTTASASSGSQQSMTTGAMRELNVEKLAAASQLQHNTQSKHQQSTSSTPGKRRSYDLNLTSNGNGGTPCSPVHTSLQELPLTIRSNEIAHDDVSRVSLKSLRLSLALESLSPIRSISRNRANGGVQQQHQQQQLRHSNQFNAKISAHSSNRDNWFLVRYLASPLALIVYALIVYFGYSDLGSDLDSAWLLLIEVSDATIAVTLVMLLFAASYPPMKRAGKILLQTAPEGVDLVSLKRDLEVSSPLIVAVKDLHVWSLTPRSNRVATCSLILNKKLIANEQQVRDIISEAKYKFLDQNIKCTTIEPVLGDADTEN